MQTRPSKFIEIPVWWFSKIIPTHTSVSIYLKNQSIDPYFLVTCTWKPENWLTSYYKWSKHLLLQIPIKSRYHQSSLLLLQDKFPIMQLQIKDFQHYLHKIFLEILAINRVVHKFMFKESTRDKWPTLTAFEKTS